MIGKLHPAFRNTSLQRVEYGLYAVVGLVRLRLLLQKLLRAFAVRAQPDYATEVMYAPTHRPLDGAPVFVL